MNLLYCLLAVLPVPISEPVTWSTKLGYPADKRVIILHADDIGMCYEANASAQRALSKGEYRSAAAMVPCPWFNEMAEWCVANPHHDVGLHLALTSEWKTYRWGSVAPRDKVPGLHDKFGYLHHNVPGVVMNSNEKEIETELFAQYNRAVSLGMKPSHVDTHMGTLYAKPEFTRAYMKLAVEKQVPAMVIEMTPYTMDKFRKQGYPMRDEMLQLIADYPLPKLDDFHAVESGKTYEEKKSKFYTLIRSLRPGLHEIIYHPSIDTPGLKKITGSWQQRIWEDKMFADAEVQDFLKEQGIILSSWKEVMERFQKK
ncbi:MAG: polysaccharide deacetylase family protein [Planctomycetia bacterium]|nr:polysaccharide deacetylase family protein [Planctomycetia bacterium]